MRSLLNHAVLNAPWVLITSLSSGLSNYLILLILSHYYGLATSGQFRLLLSIVALIGLASMTDVGKILIKQMVMGVGGLVRPLIICRLKWSLLGSAIGIVVAAVLNFRGDELAIPVLVASLLMPVSQSTRLFMQINQAKRQFRLNAGYNVIKFGSLVMFAFVMAHTGSSALYFFSGYFTLIMLFHVYFISRQNETFEPSMEDPKPYVLQGVKLSASRLFPVFAEHADKFLVSYMFGLETLGLYTIAVSTGRLVLNFVKPMLTIYFASFVNETLRIHMIAVIFLLLTCIGAVLAYLLKFYYLHVLPEIYMDGYLISATILCGLGCYTIGVVSYYSAVLHRDSSIIIPTLTNIITFGAMMIYWTIALIWGGSWTLVLFAAAYPLREILNLIFINLLKARLEPA